MTTVSEGSTGVTISVTASRTNVQWIFWSSIWRVVAERPPWASWGQDGIGRLESLHRFMRIREALFELFLKILLYFFSNLFLTHLKHLVLIYLYFWMFRAAFRLPQLFSLSNLIHQSFLSLKKIKISLFSNVILTKIMLNFVMILVVLENTWIKLFVL